MSDQEKIAAQTSEWFREQLSSSEELARDFFAEVVAPLLTTARREGAEQALKQAAHDAAFGEEFTSEPGIGTWVEAWLDDRAGQIAKGDDEPPCVHRWTYNGDEQFCDECGAEA